MKSTTVQSPFNLTNDRPITLTSSVKNLVTLFEEKFNLKPATGTREELGKRNYSKDIQESVRVVTELQNIVKESRKGVSREGVKKINDIMTHLARFTINHEIKRKQEGGICYKNGEQIKEEQDTKEEVLEEDSGNEEQDEGASSDSATIWSNEGATSDSGASYYVASDEEEALENTYESASYIDLYSDSIEENQIRKSRRAESFISLLEVMLVKEPPKFKRNAPRYPEEVISEAMCAINGLHTMLARKKISEECTNRISDILKYVTQNHCDIEEDGEYVEEEIRANEGQSEETNMIFNTADISFEEKSSNWCSSDMETFIETYPESANNSNWSNEALESYKTSISAPSNWSNSDLDTVIENSREWDRSDVNLDEAFFPKISKTTTSKYSELAGEFAENAIYKPTYLKAAKSTSTINPYHGRIPAMLDVKRRSGKLERSSTIYRQEYASIATDALSTLVSPLKGRKKLSSTYTLISSSFDSNGATYELPPQCSGDSPNQMQVNEASYMTLITMGKHIFTEEGKKSFQHQLYINEKTIAQTEKMISYAEKNVKGFIGSPAHLDAQRVLLLAKARRQVLQDYNLKLLSGDKGDFEDTTLGFIMNNLRLYPNSFKEDLRRTDRQMYYFCILEHNLCIYATHVVAPSPNACLEFENSFLFPDLPTNFVITIKLYSVKVKKQTKSKFTLLKSAFKTPLFKVANVMQCTLNNIADGEFTIYSENIRASAELSVKFPWPKPLGGLLNVGTGRRAIIWHKLWCIMKESNIKYYLCPSDVTYKTPMGNIDLTDCMEISETYLYSPYKFNIKIALNKDDNGTAVLLSCENKEEHELWRQSIEKAKQIIDVRRVFEQY